MGSLDFGPPSKRAFFFSLVFSAMKASVIDLKANPPAIVATVESGAGATGTAINPAGTMALVANHLEGTVSIFSISGKTLAQTGKIDFGDPNSAPAGIPFSPDGTIALLTPTG